MSIAGAMPNPIASDLAYLPQRQQPIHVGMMEEEDGVERSDVRVLHVPAAATKAVVHLCVHACMWECL